MTGARAGSSAGRLPRIASEASDIEYLRGALTALCDLVRSDVPNPSRSLLDALWTSRYACGRVLKNRDDRAARQAQRKEERRAQHQYRAHSLSGGAT